MNKEPRRDPPFLEKPNCSHPRFAGRMVTDLCTRNLAIKIAQTIHAPRKTRDIM